MVYIDTSVLAAYYCPEALSSQAEAAITACDMPAISLLVDVELHSALARKVREGALTEQDAILIRGQFRFHLEGAYYTVVGLEPVHYGLARDWVGTLPTALRTLDALHVATAFTAGAGLLTADRRLAEAARHLGVQTQLVA